MSPGSPLEAAERSLGQVVVPVGRSDRFGAAHRPAPWRRVVARPAGSSRAPAAPRSFGRTLALLRLVLVAAGHRPIAMLGPVPDLPLLLPATGRVIDRSLAMSMMRRLRRGLCVDMRATAGVRAIRRRVFRRLGLDDGVSLRWPHGRAGSGVLRWPGDPSIVAGQGGWGLAVEARAALALGGSVGAVLGADVGVKVGASLGIAEGDGVLVGEGSPVGSGVGSAVGRASARRSVRTSAPRSVPASAPRSDLRPDLRPGLGSDPRPVLRSAPGSRPVRVTGAAVRSECRGSGRRRLARSRAGRGRRLARRRRRDRRRRARRARPGARGRRRGGDRARDRCRGGGRRDRARDRCRPARAFDARCRCGRRGRRRQDGDGRGRGAGKDGRQRRGPCPRRGVARSGRRRRGGDVTAAGRRARGCGGTRCSEILLWGKHRPDGEGEDHEAEVDATQGDDEPMALRRRQLAPPVTAHPGRRPESLPAAPG